MLNIAIVTAISPDGFAIGGESLATVLTGQRANGSAVDLVAMRVPPLIAASVGAELLLLSPCILSNGSTAAATGMLHGRY